MEDREGEAPKMLWLVLEHLVKEITAERGLRLQEAA
jgi:hypothetical protein